MSEPMASETENWNVQGIVSSVIGLQSSGSFKPGDKGSVSLAEAGLEKPLGTIKLIDKNAREYKVEIGKKAVMSNDTYVRVGGKDDVLITTKDFSTDLKNDAAHYRGKSLFKNANRNAAKLTIEYEGRKFDFTKKDGADEWVMNSPAKAYALPDKVRGIVSGLAQLRVDKFIDDSPVSLETFGLTAPYLTVNLTTEEKKAIPESQPAADAATQPAEPKFETITKHFGVVVGGFADAGSTSRFIKLPDQPWVGTASKDAIEKLVPKDVRDTRITRMKADAASQLELTVGESTALLTRQNGKWSGGDELKDIDEEAVKNLLQAFEDAKAIDFVDSPDAPAKYGLDQPRAKIKVSTAGSVEPTTLLIGSNTPSGRNTHVQVAGQSSVLVISAELAARLAVEPQALRSRAIFDLRPEEIHRMERVRGETRFVAVKQGAEWTLEEPSAPADPASTRELANDLARLRAKRIVGKGDPAAHGLDEPMLTFHFTIEKAPPPVAGPEAESQPAPAQKPVIETHTLKVGRANNVTYAQRDDDPTIFELDDTLFRTFTAELIRRAVFEGVFTGKDVNHIQIEGNNATAAIDFIRDGKEWKYQIDPSVKVLSKKVDDFAAELAGLRAESYIAYTDADAEKLGLTGAVVATITLADGKTVTLKVDQAKRGELPRIALWVEQNRAFLMRVGDADKLIRGVDFYAKPDVPEPAEGQAPPPGAPPGVRPPPRPPGNP
jgi:hypothetical protein